VPAPIDVVRRDAGSLAELDQVRLVVRHPFDQEEDGAEPIGATGDEGAGFNAEEVAAAGEDQDVLLDVRPGLAAKPDRDGCPLRDERPPLT